MTAADLILALGLAVSQPLADAIDRHCDTVACKADAVATCYVETRCQLGHCGRNGCGPFQQLGRYADDIPELVELTIPERRELLNTCPDTAMMQYLAVMTRYRARHGDRWPWRYNGSANAERYLEHWWMIRRKLERREMDRREAIGRLQALIRDMLRAEMSAAALARLEDALDKLLQEVEKCSNT